MLRAVSGFVDTVPHRLGVLTHNWSRVVIHSRFHERKLTELNNYVIDCFLTGCYKVISAAIKRMLNSEKRPINHAAEIGNNYNTSI
jgi:hypothetical protein